MNEEPIWSTAEQIEAPARSLGMVALVLFVVFATGLTTVLFPLRLLDPGWQLRLCNALVSAALAPLVGLALLRLAVAVNPQDPVLLGRWRLCSGLAVAASLGFLLLLPLHGQASWRQQQAMELAQNNRLRGAAERLTELRRVVAGADSAEAMNKRLQELRGPQLAGVELAQPLPLLKSRLALMFQQAEQELRAARKQLDDSSRLKLLPEWARNGVACLALAAGFASLAHRPDVELSLLQELHNGLQLRRIRRAFERRSREKEEREQDELSELIREEKSLRPPAIPAPRRMRQLVETLEDRRSIQEQRQRFEREARAREQREAREWEAFHQLEAGERPQLAPMIQRPRALRALLDLLQDQLLSLRMRRQMRRASRRGQVSEEEYVRQLSGEDEQAPPQP